MNGLICSGLLSFITPAPKPPAPAFPAWEIKNAPPIVLKQANKAYDYAGKIYRMGNIPKWVVEYGIPSLQAKADKITVRNFYWQGSMEGVHVGSQPFNSKGMRQAHQPISVVFENLYCRDIGEDCLSFQPRSQVILRNSEFQGNLYIKPKGEGNLPGMDKIIQIDGAKVLIENCTFRNGFTAIRGKANSVITVRNCNFIDCRNAVSGDGNPNPRPGQEYDNGSAGVCQIKVENCRFWHCHTLFTASQNCEITTSGCKGYKFLHWSSWKNEGKVTVAK
jgi:hypothetical protein